jgi:type I restriction enzyme S subunit
MSFPRYERYKDTGVEWLGAVPEHWSIRRMKTLFEIKKRIAGEIGYDILSITQNGIKIKDTESNEGQLAMDYAKYQLVYPGDFAMNHMDLLTGYIDISTVEGVTSPDYRVFSIRNLTACHASYFLRLFQSAYHQKIFYAFGQGASQFGRWRLPTEAFNEFTLPYPPACEQALISVFLDQETAKIDALIEEQRRLIELLKEKRQAIILLAVTKGLNASVPTKQTPDRWLGSIPDHWTVVGAKFVSTIFVPQRNKPELNQEGDGIPWITMDQMKEVEVETSGYWVSQEAAQATGTRTLNKGAVIASCVGNFGAASVNVCDVVINQQLQAFIPNERIRTMFLRYRVESAKTYFEEIGTAATIPYVNQQGFAGMQIGLPPLCEQDKIVEYLDRVVSEIDNLITSATDAAAILWERRSSLVHAAVTGKIDVRNYTPKEAA